MTTVALRVTSTGGRNASTRHIPPKLALAVGMPATPAPEGWRWSPLSDLARLESGHTPSRRHPEYWGGAIPWIGIQDARAHDGRRIEDTEEKINELGIENSSARVLPENTVCLSRTASVGYVVLMASPMATSQDFVNWVCSKHLDHNFLKYLFIAEDEDLLRFASGSVHQTIYFPEVKAFHICHPSFREQQRIVGILDEAFEGIATAKDNTEKNLQNARALFESHLQSVFSQRSEGWVERRLGDVAETQYGLSEPMNEEGKGFKIFRMGEVQGGRLIDTGRMKFADINRAEFEKYKLQTSDILFNRTNSFALVGKTGIFDMPGDYCFASYLVRVLLDRKVVLPEFLNYFMNSERFQDSVKQKASKSINQANINATILSNESVRFPESLKEQKTIVTRLDGLREESQRLESLYQRKLAALEALKRSLLHQAFSGQL
jgi:type I restriction enzyme S subunit